MCPGPSPAAPSGSATTPPRRRRADLEGVGRKLARTADGAGCSLPSQQQALVGSIVEKFADEFEAHVRREADAVEPHLVTEMLDLDGYEAVVDVRFATKQPD